MENKEAEILNDLIMSEGFDELYYVDAQVIEDDDEVFLHAEQPIFGITISDHKGNELELQ